MTELVDSRRQLADLAERLAGRERLFVDTEFLTERTYYPRLCLVQLAAGDVIAAVDPFECGDPAPLAEAFSDVELVLHAGEQDLELLDRWLGVVPERIFDTQIAAAFVGHGHSIAYTRLVRACCDVQLRRSRAFTDWSRRPLDDDQIGYALDDVRYLPGCYDSLVERLEEKGRLEWARQECALAREAALERTEPEEMWRKVSSARRFRSRDLAVLQELAAWREHEARRRDEPRKRIAPDRVLLELARRKPSEPNKLVGMRGLHPREAKRSGEAIVAAIQRGLARPADDWPRWPASRRRDEDPAVPDVATLLDAWLRARARELELSTRLIANRDDLERLVRAFIAEPEAPETIATDIGILRGWRRDVAGEDLVRILRGELRLGVERRDGTVTLGAVRPPES